MIPGTKITGKKCPRCGQNMWDLTAIPPPTRAMSNSKLPDNQDYVVVNKYCPDVFFSVFPGDIIALNDFLLINSVITVGKYKLI